MRIPAVRALVGLVLLPLVVSGCTGTSQYEYERLPPIEGYHPSEWDMDRYRSDLARLADDLEIDEPPTVEIVRWVNREAVVDTMVSCLAGKGVSVRKVDDQGFQITSPPGQEAATNLAHYECSAQYPVRLDTERPATDEEQQALYAYLVDVWLPCAADLGYTEIAKPDFETYGAALRQETADPVLEDLDSNYALDQSAYDTLYAACPYRPSAYRQYDR